MRTDIHTLEDYAYPLISRYSGWGGGDEGAHQAGLHTMFAVDNDLHSCLCHRLNHPRSPILHADLTKMTAEQTLQLTGMPLWKYWVYLTTAPCQGVSSAGLFDPFNPMNRLMLNEPWFISQLKPAVFVFENVSAVNKGRMKILKAMLVREVNEHLVDYNVLECTLNSAHYKTPQDRKRYILLGVRKDLGVMPSFPAPDLNVRSIGDTLPHIEGIRFGHGMKNYRPAWRPSPTLTKTENLYKVVNGKTEKLNEAEILALCGYPSDWKYTGSRNKVFNRAGNSVMPPLAKAIFEEVRSILQRAGVEPCLKKDLYAITDVTVPHSLTFNPDAPTLPVLPNLKSLSQSHSEFAHVPLF
jgi:site-specific DNA-cytosine methylase